MECVYFLLFVQDENMRLVNQYEAGVCRTTNFCEGWHRGLKPLFTMSSPELGYFLTEMREELLRHQTQAIRILKGRVPIKKREAHVAQAEVRVGNAKNRLENYIQTHYNENDGNFYVEVETLEHYARHQARNCSTQLPLLNLNGDNNNANDDSILIMN
jgi:hypothetical protein